MHRQNLRFLDKAGICKNIEGEYTIREGFFRLFDEEFQSIKEQYTARGIAYRPAYRRRALASVELDNYFNPNYTGENKLSQARENYEFIDEAIERVLQTLLQQQR